LKKIKLFEPYHDSKESNAIQKVLKSNFWASGAGIGNVKKFEKAFANYIGVNSCISVNSGTAALHLALSLLDIYNKKVILPSLSFVSTAHSVIYNHAKPIFVDIDVDTLCIKADDIIEHIDENTKLILPVHFGGMPCDLSTINKIAKNNRIFTIEDAAHACGSRYGNKKIGSHSDFVCFSFHPVKNLSMPSGGAITFNKKNGKIIENILKSRRWCGISSRQNQYYDVKDIGWNFYLNEFSAAIGIEQIKKLDEMNKKRQHIAKRYHDEIKLNEKMPFDKNCSYHLYWVLLKNRDDFIKYMNNKKIETGIHYRPIHRFSYYKKKINLPNTEYVAKHIVSIPMHPNLSDDEISLIITNVNKYVT